MLTTTSKNMGVLQSSFYPLALTHTLKAVLLQTQFFSGSHTMKAKDYELFIISQNSLQIPTWLCTLLFQRNTSLVLNKRDYEYFMISQNNLQVYTWL